MTLFDLVAADGNIFHTALEQHFAGHADQRTLSLV
jgi:uncharacterized protein (DUF1810 family)